MEAKPPIRKQFTWLRIVLGGLLVLLGGLQGLRYGYQLNEVREYLMWGGSEFLKAYAWSTHVFAGAALLGLLGGLGFASGHKWGCALGLGFAIGMLGIDLIDQWIYLPDLIFLKLAGWDGAYLAYRWSVRGLALASLGICWWPGRQLRWRADWKWALLSLAVAGLLVADYLWCMEKLIPAVLDEGF